MENQKVWFVTGASKGLGLTLIKLLLAGNNKVVATSRNAQEIELQLGQRENLLALTVNLADNDSVRNAVDQAVNTFGHIDVAVNNAGYTLYGSVEAMTDLEFRQMMDINFFGAVNVIRNIMPYFRKQQSGHMINISSIAGYKGFGNSPAYASSKFAVIGLSEALAEEAAIFNVKVTVVAPGFFRTDFLNKGSEMVCANPIPEYQTETLVKRLKNMNGSQTGDPEKMAKVLIEITNMQNPPLHLLMGPDAYQIVSEKRQAENQEFEKWKALTFSTNIEAD